MKSKVKYVELMEVWKCHSVQENEINQAHVTLTHDSWSIKERLELLTWYVYGSKDNVVSTSCGC